MKIVHGKYMVETRLIQSVSLDGWSKEEWMVNIAFTHSGAGFKFTTKVEAELFINKIMEAMEEEIKDGKTYLDGFKDGTEYALRLIKAKDNQ